MLLYCSEACKSVCRVYTVLSVSHTHTRMHTQQTSPQIHHDRFCSVTRCLRHSTHTDMHTHARILCAGWLACSAVWAPWCPVKRSSSDYDVSHIESLLRPVPNRARSVTETFCQHPGWHCWPSHGDDDDDDDDVVSKLPQHRSSSGKLLSANLSIKRLASLPSLSLSWSPRLNISLSLPLSLHPSTPPRNSVTNQICHTLISQEALLLARESTHKTDI